MAGGDGAEAHARSGRKHRRVDKSGQPWLLVDERAEVNASFPTFPNRSDEDRPETTVPEVEKIVSS